MSSQIHLEVLTDKSYRPVEGNFIVRLALKLEVSDLAETLPLCLCLAVDCSNSMRGEKLRQARLSALTLLDALRPGDRVCLLRFHSSADLLLPPSELSDATLAQARHLIETHLTEGGVTRLDLALAKTYEVFAQVDDHFMKQLMVLSDGAPTLPNGEILPEPRLRELERLIHQGFLEQQVSVTTIGVGDAKSCHAEFLESCADKGAGIFYHATDPQLLRTWFLEAFQRAAETAISKTSVYVRHALGQIQRAASVVPDIRDLPQALAENEGFSIELGSLRRGEQHIFLIEMLTPPRSEAGKVQLCQIAVDYRLNDSPETQQAKPLFIEYSLEDALLDKPDHPEVEKYKQMYNAFLQTRKATENIRLGGDPKKTQVLLSSASKVTQRLGLSKQTKLLQELASKIQEGEAVSEDELSQLSNNARKTKVLSV